MGLSTWNAFTTIVPFLKKTNERFNSDTTEEALSSDNDSRTEEEGEGAESERERRRKEESTA